MKMKIYVIRERVPYGEYVHIVGAKSRREAKKLANISSDGKIEEIKLIKPTKAPKIIFFGGSQE